MPTFNQAFIDGQNLKISTINAYPSWNIDLKRLRIYLKEKYQVQEAYYFIGAFDPKNQDLYNALQRYGYIVIFREHAESSISHKKGNVDTDIVFTIMRKLVEKDPINQVILISGDGDYWRMVDFLIKQQKFKKLLAPNKRALSSLYRKRTPDRFIDFFRQQRYQEKNYI